MTTQTQAVIHEIPVRRADGTETSLADHAGEVMLIVNVASRCGLTPQYDALVAIHEKYRDRGFTVLGFPANDFGAQEPGSDAEIQEFCRLGFGVDFPVFGKITVKGEEKHPLYRHLTQTAPNSIQRSGILRQKLAAAGKLPPHGEVTWNFEKFLVNRRGEVVARFAPDVVPVDPMIIEVIESELGNRLY